MNREEFWKKFPPIPGFNCLKMKHDIQKKIYEETKGMSQEERLEYYRAGARKLRRAKRRWEQKNEPMFIKEESVSFDKKSKRKH